MLQWHGCPQWVGKTNFYMDCGSKCETVKILEEDIRQDLHDLRVGKDFLNRTQNMLAIDGTNGHTGLH